MPSRVRVLLAALVAALLAAMALGGCRVVGEVAVRVDEDGAGQVEVTVDFDAEAARRLGDPATELALDDLAAGGWEVRGPQGRDDGGVEVAAVKPFGSPDDLQAVLSEVGGDVFAGFGIDVGSGFASTEWSLEGRVQLSGSLDQFGDDELTAALDGLALGRTPEELAAELADGGFGLRMRVELPEPVAEPDDTTGTATDFPAPAVTWDWDLPGDAVDAEVAAVATRREVGPLRWLALGAVALLLAASVWVLGRLAGRRRPGAGPDVGGAA